MRRHSKLCGLRKKSWLPSEGRRENHQNTAIRWGRGGWGPRTKDLRKISHISRERDFKNPFAEQRRKILAF